MKYIICTSIRLSDNIDTRKQKVYKSKFSLGLHVLFVQKGRRPCRPYECLWIRFGLDREAECERDIECGYVYYNNGCICFKGWTHIGRLMMECLCFRETLILHGCVKVEKKNTYISTFSYWLFYIWILCEFQWVLCVCVLAQHWPSIDHVIWICCEEKFCLIVICKRIQN